MFFRCNAKFLWKRAPEEIKVVSFILSVRKLIKKGYGIEIHDSCVDEFLVFIPLNFSFTCLLTYLFICSSFCVFKSTPELAKLWNVGCHMWKRDFVSIYGSLKEEWSPTIQPIMAALEGEISSLQLKILILLTECYAFL